MSFDVRYKVQRIFFIVYIVLSILFYFGWYDTIYKKIFPDEIGDLFALFAMIYYGFAGFLIPVGWFAFVIYNYQVYPPKEDELHFENKKAFINKYFFNIAGMINFFMTSLFLVILTLGKNYFNTDFLFINLGAIIFFSLIFKVLQNLKEKDEIKSTLIIFSSLSVLLIGLFINSITNISFEEALLNEAIFIYNLSYQTVYYLLIMMGLFFFGYVFFGYFNIKNRIKFVNLVYYLFCFYMIILNLFNMVGVFNFLKNLAG